MNILSMENVGKSFSEKVLFEQVSLGIGDNDRLGLVGINGTGKSTFLKIEYGEAAEVRIKEGKEDKVKIVKINNHLVANLFLLK